MNLTIYVITAALIGFVFGVAVTANMMKPRLEPQGECTPGDYDFKNGKLYFCAESYPRGR